MKLKSFGCSFIYGTDLSDNDKDSKWPRASELTWPALIAKELGFSYQCYARPGAGNLSILEKILSQIETSHNEPACYVIGWTYIDRFDYLSAENSHREHWETLRPGSDGSLEHFYYKYLHSELSDKLSNLIYIETAINTLQEKNIPFFMTYQDELLFDQRWHCPPSVVNLQTRVQPHMHNFEGNPFVTWSRDCGFEISETAHPLEPAHQAAAQLMLPLVKQCLKL